MDDGFGARAIELFNQRHMAEYNHIREHEIIEISGVRLVAQIATPSPDAAAGFSAKGGDPKRAKTRRANLGNGFSETPIYLAPTWFRGTRS